VTVPTPIMCVTCSNLAVADRPVDPAPHYDTVTQVGGVTRGR
jgi:hypothetical protein